MDVTNVEQLWGTWRLVETTSAVLKEGCLAYTEDGYVFAFASAPLERRPGGVDPEALSPAQALACIKTGWGYCGTYELNSPWLRHHILHGTFPSWVGRDAMSRRHARLEGGLLILSGDNTTLKWQRTSS